MYSKFLDDFVINESENIFKAHWKLYKNNMILVVLDDNEKFVGVLTKGNFSKTYFYSNNNCATVGEICTKNCKFISDNDDIYSSARSIFAENDNIAYIPVLDKDKNLIDIFSRHRAFYKKYLMKNELPRMHYAICIWYAALEAKKLGYESISIIEFGVAGGSGLVACEFHAREIKNILGINIEVYGFDNATGFPEYAREDYRNLPYMWNTGDFTMNKELLENSLRFSKLVIGDVNDTLNTFFEKYSPAPIGAMFIDVDFYVSTMPVLDMLNNDDKYFIPRIYMYFDDLFLFNELQGETLAIKEFNNKYSEYMNISPELVSARDDCIQSFMLNENVNTTGRIKKCHRFKHPLYNETLYKDLSKIVSLDLKMIL